MRGVDIGGADIDAPWLLQDHLHTILGEEWEHLRFAIRDLDAIASTERALSRN